GTGGQRTVDTLLGCSTGLRFRRSVGRLGALLRDDADLGADREGVPLCRADLGQDAGHRRGNLRVDLVGRDLNQGVVFLDPVAHLLQPGTDRALGDALAELGEPDLSAVTDRGHTARSPSRARLVAYPSPPLPRGVRGNGYGMRVPCPAACYSSSPPLPWWERGRGVRGGPSECRELLQRGADLLRGGQVGLLQRRAEGHGRYLRPGDAHDRPIEVGEGFLGD